MSDPFLSVIMPVRNEGKFLAKALGAVFTQDYPADRVEIIVADGMSTDGTREMLAEMQKEHPNLQTVDNPGRIVPTGMNRAIAIARGEIIVRVDGHCEIEPDYLRRCVDHLQQQTDVDGVGGPVQTVGETVTARAIAIAMSSKFGVGGSAFRTTMDKTMLVDTVPFPAYRRSTVDRAGPYDEELVRNQDDEYNYRLRKLGGKLLLASDIRSRYYSRSTLRSLWRQYLQYGYWKVRVMQKHTWQMSLRQIVPACFVVTLIALTIAAFFSIYAATALAALVGLYAVANLSAALSEAKRAGDWRVVALLPLCFAILHISYGCGFLHGLVRFCGRWRDRSTMTQTLPKPVSST